MSVGKGGNRLQVEFSFTLPRGYVDESGNIHREGVIRLARAIDEIAPFDDRRTSQNEAYLSIVLLSRVIVRLGSISPVLPRVIENMFASDFAYLQDLYLGINQQGSRFFETECPSCGQRFALDLTEGSSNQADSKGAKVAQHA
jgi:hypothetical protein